MKVVGTYVSVSLGVNVRVVGWVGVNNPTEIQIVGKRWRLCIYYLQCPLPWAMGDYIYSDFIMYKHPSNVQSLIAHGNGGYTG